MPGGGLALGFAQLRDASAARGVAPEFGRSGIADAQLIAIARESHADAIEVLYDAYKSRIYTFLLRLLADPEMADDLTQDVFTRAYQAMGTLTSEHRVLPWLYRIANNAAIDHLRRRKRFSWLRVDRLLGTSEEPYLAGAQGDVPEQDQVRAVLALLTMDQSTALLLHALEGYSYKEIAEIQGSTLAAVRSRIARGRQAFIKAYETKERSGSS
ncbi:MAG: sigma-70 family RNA polymerase sigma factor [Chloroflexota bacterium]|nr:sigma-70 family RNA polymerase sigma factor [Chloroflexota bacterium]